ncbi:PTS sugar transporter subunit IIA [Anaerosacchariphilus polymeriproducens]|uniref:PTS glucose transporter subunit IIA n=1 Tax=Anaerosacchariphilus polymeriproducens TaxID=1812858 RepID=A0A371AXB9_9FIRM|nr:PTS glucose transporter subunit IIA [Anaerosacchariphilus polymeriproducens]RDU24225.1 PTS glucose transporter subunit IIA [Anaerosacchariphilus polymeriproducens]
MTILNKLFSKHSEKTIEKKSAPICAPVDGTILPLESVQDAAFSQKTLGDGFAIEPENGEFYSPVTGKIVACFPTMHAYGIIDETGLEILLHIGIDTVDLGGHGFTTYVKENQTIKQGEKIASVDLEILKQAEKPATTMVILTNGESCQLLKAGQKVIHNETDILLLT